LTVDLTITKLSTLSDLCSVCNGGIPASSLANKNGEPTSTMGQIHNSPESPEVSVFLLAENRLLRDTLARLLRKRSEVNVVGISGDTDAVHNAIATSGCEAVLTDCFSNGNHSGLLLEFLNRNPEIKILLFGMDEDEDIFIRAVQLGVRGYILKDAAAAEIINAIRIVARGEAFCPPRLCLRLIQHISNEHRLKPKNEPLLAAGRNGLTHRQLELMHLVAQGLTNKEIAASLNLSEFTVKNHIRRVMRQMEADSRHEAVDLIRATGHLATL
jgi:DNA-binding NarL/FixJ family response regulator